MWAGGGTVWMGCGARHAHATAVEHGLNGIHRCFWCLLDWLGRSRLSLLQCELVVMEPVALAVVDDEFLTLSEGPCREQTHLEFCLAIAGIELDEGAKLDVGSVCDTAVVINETRLVAQYRLSIQRRGILVLVVKLDGLNGVCKRCSIRIGRLVEEPIIVAKAKVVCRVKVGIPLCM